MVQLEYSAGQMVKITSGDVMTSVAVRFFRTGKKLKYDGQNSGNLWLTPLPCIRLACGKFESTNQVSAGGKNFIILTSM